MVKDIFQIYGWSEDEFEDRLKAITKLDTSCCGKINALSEEDYTYMISHIVRGIVYFSVIDLGQASQNNIEESQHLLQLLDGCRPAGEIVSVIRLQKDSAEQKSVLQEIESKLLHQYKK